MKTLIEHQAEVKAAQNEMQEAKVFLQFFKQHPEYANDANRAMLKEYHNGEEITLKSLLESVQVLQNQLSIRSEKRMEKDAIEEHLGLISQFVEAMSGWSTEAVQNELSKARYLTNEQIAEKTALIAAKNSLQSSTTAELKKIIRDSKPDIVEDDLPAKYDRAALLALPSKDFRKICEFYGLEIVTKRLNER